nr:uncharacterized protein LOC112060730 [Chrysemys picta bellii]
MEMAGVSPCYAQHRGGTQPAVQHDHGAYGVPQEPAALGRMVRELQETVHRQNQLLQSSQEALAASQERCQELQERSESECWALASELGQRITALEAENRNLRCERDQLESQTQGLREELERSRSTVLHISQKLKEQGGRAGPGRFCLASVRDDGKWLRFYTGFGSAQRLAAFLAFLTEGEPQRGAEPGPPSALSPEDQLFLVLVRLRLGLLLQDLAFRFHLSEATVSRYWLGWTQLMETRLAQVPVRCSPRYVERFEPQRAARVGGVPLVVLDCAQLCFEGRGRQLYALQGCALAAPSGFLAFCCSAALRGREGGRGCPPSCGTAPWPSAPSRGRPAGRCSAWPAWPTRPCASASCGGSSPPPWRARWGGPGPSAATWPACCMSPWGWPRQGGLPLPPGGGGPWGFPASPHGWQVWGWYRGPGFPPASDWGEGRSGGHPRGLTGGPALSCS